MSKKSQFVIDHLNKMADGYDRSAAADESHIAELEGQVVEMKTSVAMKRLQAKECREAAEQ